MLRYLHAIDDYYKHYSMVVVIHLFIYIHYY